MEINFKINKNVINNLIRNIEKELNEKINMGVNYKLRKDSELFLKIILEKKNKTGENIFDFNINDFNQIPNIASNISAIFNDLKSHDCISKMSSIFLGGNIHIELTMDGIDYFKDKQQLNANNTGGQNIIINEVNGGQLNIAQDGSHITSTQNNGLQADKLEMIIKDIMDNLNGLNEEQYETIIDSIEMAREELINPQPKKSILRTCIKMLSPIITAVNGTPALYENLQKLNEIITSYLA